MNSKLKMAIVGAGIWGQNHAAIYRAHPFAEVVAICDRNLGRAKALAERLGVEAYADMDVMRSATPAFSSLVESQNPVLANREH